MANVLINLTDVSYTYFDKPILAGLSWEIQAGQKIGLVGANGAGKSTLLGLILGQTRARHRRDLPRQRPHHRLPRARRGRTTPSPPPQWGRGSG